MEAIIKKHDEYILKIERMNKYSEAYDTYFSSFYIKVSAIHSPEEIYTNNLHIVSSPISCGLALIRGNTDFGYRMNKDTLLMKNYSDIIKNIKNTLFDINKIYKDSGLGSVPNIGSFLAAIDNKNELQISFLEDLGFTKNKVFNNWNESVDHEQSLWTFDTNYHDKYNF